MSFVNSSTRITSFLHNNLAREIQDSIKSKGKKRQTEERNLLIDEMRVEIERLGAQNKSLISNEADKILFRYRKGVVHELKRNLAAATGSSPSDYTFGSTSLYDIENSRGCFREKSFHVEDIASSDNKYQAVYYIKIVVVIFRERKLHINIVVTDIFIMSKT